MAANITITTRFSRVRLYINEATGLPYALSYRPDEDGVRGSSISFDLLTGAPPASGDRRDNLDVLREIYATADGLRDADGVSITIELINFTYSTDVADLGQLTGWGSIMYSHRRSMEQYFYKTKLVTTEGQISFRPVAFHLPDVTGGFPNFTSLHVRPMASTWHDAVMQDLGMCGGAHGLSDDTSAKQVTIKFTQPTLYTAVYEGDAISTAIRFTYTEDNATPVELECEATDPFARVVYGTPTTKPFVPRGDNVVLTFKIIAEDDTEEDYSVTIIPDAS